MPTHFEETYQAILDDDASKAARLIRKDPGLTARAFAEDRFEPIFTHWIYSGDILLHLAAAGHRAEIAQMLLDAGADPGSAGNRRRSQPLHYAADGHVNSPTWDERRQVETIQLLLRAGAVIDAREQNGATPLHRAVRTRCAAAVKGLLEAEADAMIANNSGSTPFHLAVQNTGRGGSGSDQAKEGQTRIIRTFLDRGFKASMRDGRGRTVSDYAKSGWIQELLAGGSIQSRPGTRP